MLLTSLLSLGKPKELQGEIGERVFVSGRKQRRNYYFIKKAGPRRSTFKLFQTISDFLFKQY